MNSHQALRKSNTNLKSNGGSISNMNGAPAQSQTQCHWCFATNPNYDGPVPTFRSLQPLVMSTYTFSCNSLKKYRSQNFVDRCPYRSFGSTCNNTKAQLVHRYENRKIPLQTFGLCQLYPPKSQKSYNCQQNSNSTNNCSFQCSRNNFPASKFCQGQKVFVNPQSIPPGCICLSPCYNGPTSGIEGNKNVREFNENDFGKNIANQPRKYCNNTSNSLRNDKQEEYSGLKVCIYTASEWAELCPNGVFQNSEACQGIQKIQFECLADKNFGPSSGQINNTAKCYCQCNVQNRYNFEANQDMQAIQFNCIADKEFDASCSQINNTRNCYCQCNSKVQNQSNFEADQGTPTNQCKCIADNEFGPSSGQMTNTADCYCQCKRNVQNQSNFEADFNGLTEAENRDLEQQLQSGPKTSIVKVKGAQNDKRLSLFQISSESFFGDDEKSTGSDDGDLSDEEADLYIYKSRRSKQRDAKKEAYFSKSKSKVKDADLSKSKSPIKNEDISKSRSKVKGADIARSKSPIKNADISISRSKVKGADIAKSKTPIKRADISKPNNSKRNANGDGDISKSKSTRKGVNKDAVMNSKDNKNGVNKDAQTFKAKDDKAGVNKDAQIFKPITSSNKREVNKDADIAKSKTMQKVNKDKNMKTAKALSNEPGYFKVLPRSSIIVGKHHIDAMKKVSKQFEDLEETPRTPPFKPDLGIPRSEIRVLPPHLAKEWSKSAPIDDKGTIRLNLVIAKPSRSPSDNYPQKTEIKSTPSRQTLVKEPSKPNSKPVEGPSDHYPGVYYGTNSKVLLKPRTSSSPLLPLEHYKK